MKHAYGNTLNNKLIKHAKHAQEYTKHYNNNETCIEINKTI